MKLSILLLYLPLVSLVAQSVVITSPTNGTVVNPGQLLTVTVAASGTFQQVFVIGQSPVGSSQQSLNAPPYQFTVQVPSTIRPDQYALTAVGVIAPGQAVNSDPVIVSVERADNPISIRVEPTLLNLYPGQMGYLRIIGLFQDGTTLDLTQSTLITYASNATGVATVGPQGIVTPVAHGSATITASYGSVSIPVPVTVPQPITVAPPRKALYASQTAKFFVQLAGLSNPSLVWSVSPNGAGSIDGTGFYTAPSSISAQQTVTVTAANAADNTQFGTATVLLYPPAAVTIQPLTASLSSSQTQLFMTGVTNAPSAGVSWSISPSGTGTINRAGLYTPPSSITGQQVVTLTAMSWADPSKSASATVTLMPSQIAPTVSFTGAPASAAYFSTFTITATTNASTTAAITASGACSVSGNVVTMTSGTGTCQLTANWAADQNYLAASATQSTSATKVTATVTANNASRAYGAANPNFTASYSGFVNGDTFATAVSGSPSLATTATASSLPGSYPILAAAGTLSAANYAFTFVNGTLTVTATGPAPASGTTCNGAYNGTFNGNVTMSSGQTCIFVSGGITGNVTLNGGSLTLSNATVGGNVSGHGNVALTGTARVNGNVTLTGGQLSADGGASVGGSVTLSGGSSLAMGNATVGGSLIMNSGGTFSVGPSAAINGNVTIQSEPTGAAQSQVCGSAVKGSLTLQSNGSAIQVGSATPVNCAGNTIGGNLAVQQNTGSAGIFINTVTGVLVCQNNSSITGSGNSASLKQGQCSGF